MINKVLSENFFSWLFVCLWELSFILVLLFLVLLTYPIWILKKTQIVYKKQKDFFIFYIVLSFLILSNIIIFSLFMLDGKRGDHFIYGRYSEVFIVIYFMLSVALYSKKIFSLNSSVKKYLLISIFITFISLYTSTLSGWTKKFFYYFNVINIYPILQIFDPEKYILVITLFLLFILFISQIFIKKENFRFVFFCS
jgi:hypothetical protein